MSKAILPIFKQGFHILHNNLYLFWINLLYIVPFAYINSFSVGKIPWIFFLSPFIIMTLKLADTQLLFTQPQSRSKIMETYVLVLYKYLFRVLFLFLFTTTIAFTVFVMSGGSLELLQTYFLAFTRPGATLTQKLISALPVILVTPIIPFFKIYWVVKKQTFFKSVYFGCLYALQNLSFSLIAPALTVLLIVIQHPIARYIEKPNPLIFNVVSIYLGLIITSASIVYFKSQKETR